MQPCSFWGYLAAIHLARAVCLHVGLPVPHTSWAALLLQKPLWPQLACAQCCKQHLPAGQQCMLPSRQPATLTQLTCMRCSKLRTPSCTVVAISWRTVSAMPTLDCSEDSPNRWLWLMLSAAVGGPGAAAGRPARAISLDACQLVRSCGSLRAEASSLGGRRKQCMKVKFPFVLCHRYEVGHLLVGPTCRAWAGCRLLVRLLQLLLQLMHAVLQALGLESPPRLNL